jgi:Tfp pilus assembly protein PilN
MLKGIVKYRPRSLCAIYVESRHIEVLRAHRRWRTWEIEPAERFPIPEGEAAVDFLQHLNIRPRGKKGSALLLFLPSIYYTIHREHYPSSLKDQLDEAINFDWQENLFHEHDRTLHFSGPPTSINHHVSVPIFSIQTEVYEKFHQGLNGSSFHTFTMLPSALSYKTFLPSLASSEGEESLEIIARILDESHLEVHRFYQGSFLDSMVIGKSVHSLRLFRENLRCLANGDGVCVIEPHIHLLCTEAESIEAEGSGREWTDEGFPVQIHKLNEPFVSHWVRHLLEREMIYTFDTELLLKPWQVPRILWPLMCILLLFAAYAFYQIHSVDERAQTGKNLKKQVNQLEVQWKPIEEFQTRISKFQEDQKTLSEFNREGYPLLELLSFLTQITPDDTWLNYVSLRKGQLILRGESKSAIKFLSELSKVDGLSDVKFASPVTRNPASDQERFNVQLQLDMEKLKKSLEALPSDKLEETPTPAVTETEPQNQGVSAPAATDNPDETPEEEVNLDDAPQVQEESQ